ncbi:capsid cement protein [Janibacter sp. GS2]|uniref:capsid cement protein n=1 Tax=Janibacter sp. GS2 TaxID=3442646 RepID=UPI003EC0CC45
MSDYAPVYKPGQEYTMSAASAVTAGQVVEVAAAGSVGPAGAVSAKVVGVAAFPAAAGEHLTVIDGGVHRLTASGAVNAGDRVVAATDGAVATSATTPETGTQLGLALTNGTDGQTVEVAWIRA